ncbi:hypothetical protein [Myroides sp. WP-1]|uniref:hypothetical protein n=1 Tax=Myroides sp. WP-1 TaxID=2759944 RepID=UPI0015FD7A36|nr:hypothetical protein [Myroides sp. WP-1]MBB1139157.1 hypothetical protein [Myroides sp. WP-1]
MTTKVKWKIIQTDSEEYFLLSDSTTIKKIKGKSAPAMVAVLASIQEEKPLDSLVFDGCPSFLQKEKREDIVSWLTENNFIHLESTPSPPVYIDLIGEFGKEQHLLNTFIEGLPEQIKIAEIYNLSEGVNFEFEEKREKVALTLLLGPFFYNAQTVEQISLFQKGRTSDFLFVELYENGLLLGPLMNSFKDTVCLTCIETRKIFNLSNPDLLINHLWTKERLEDHPISVLTIGPLPIYTSFIYNELKRILLRNNKVLYDKALFIDFNQYHNQSFRVLKSPSCEICNTLSLYNPL